MVKCIFKGKDTNYATVNFRRWKSDTFETSHLKSFVTKYKVALEYIRTLRKINILCVFKNAFSTIRKEIFSICLIVRKETFLSVLKLPQPRFLARVNTDIIILRFYFCFYFLAEQWKRTYPAIWKEFFGEKETKLSACSVSLSTSNTFSRPWLVSYENDQVVYALATLSIAIRYLSFQISKANSQRQKKQLEVRIERNLNSILLPDYIFVSIPRENYGLTEWQRGEEYWFYITFLSAPNVPFSTKVCVFLGLSVNPVNELLSFPSLVPVFLEKESEREGSGRALRFHILDTSLFALR